MPFGGGKTLTVNVSGLNWDADLTVPAAYKIKVDHVAETTGAHGIVTDQLLAPAAGVTVLGGQILKADHIAETTGAHGVVVDNVLGADHIAEKTGAHGVVVDHSLKPSAGVTIAGGQALQVDHIQESTGGHSIVPDNKVVASGGFEMAAGGTIYTNHIAELTLSHNVEFITPATGKFSGTGNSTTGVVLAHVIEIDALMAAQVGTVINVDRVRRAGTYDVKVYNHVTFAGGGYVDLLINSGVKDSTTANNAAGTTEDIGDQAGLAVGDVIGITLHTACPDSQRIIVLFYNADGMWS